MVVSLPLMDVFRLSRDRKIATFDKKYLFPTVKLSRKVEEWNGFLARMVNVLNS